MIALGQHIPSPFPIRQSLTVIAAVWLAFAVACVGVLAAIGWIDAWGVMLACGAVCAIASAVALLPMMMLAGHTPEAAAQGALIGMMIRMFLSLAGAAVIVALGPWQMHAVAGWTLGWYLLMMSVEVGLIVRYFQAAHNQAASKSVRTREGSACSAR